MGWGVAWGVCVIVCGGRRVGVGRGVKGGVWHVCVWGGSGCGLGEGGGGGGWGGVDVKMCMAVCVCVCVRSRHRWPAVVASAAGAQSVRRWPSSCGVRVGVRVVVRVGFRVEVRVISHAIRCCDAFHAAGAPRTYPAMGSRGRYRIGTFDHGGRSSCPHSTHPANGSRGVVTESGLTQGRATDAAASCKLGVVPLTVGSTTAILCASVCALPRARVPVQVPVLVRVITHQG